MIPAAPLLKFIDCMLFFRRLICSTPSTRKISYPRVSALKNPVRRFLATKETRLITHALFTTVMPNRKTRDNRAFSV
jgi:hypothetical protein